jgi:transposase
MAKSKVPDPKLDALRQQGSLNPRPQRVSDPLFASADFFDRRDLVQVKYEMLRRVSAEGHSVTQSAKAFGLSRPSFYQAQAALQREGLAGLLAKKRGPRRAHKLGSEVMGFIRELLSQEPSLSSAQLVGRVQQRFELQVHPRSIERALLRPEKKRP